MHGPAPRSPLIAGADPSRSLDILFVNAPLRDYALRPRVNDFTLPVLGMAYIATYAATPDTTPVSWTPKPTAWASAPPPR